jgi:hypothetical protein
MTKTAIFRRYVNDPSTSEQELHARSGQRVRLIGPPFRPDPVEEGMMQAVIFPDGYWAEAFYPDELSDIRDVSDADWIEAKEN